MKRHQTKGHASLSGAAKGVMRDSDGKRMTVLLEVTRTACQQLGLDWSGDLRERYRDTVGSTLARL